MFDIKTEVASPAASKEEEDEEDEVSMTTTDEKAAKDASEAAGKTGENVDPKQKLEEDVSNLKRPAPADAAADESPEVKAARSVRQIQRGGWKREESKEKQEKSEEKRKESEKKEWTRGGEGKNPKTQFLSLLRAQWQFSLTAT